MKRSLILVFCLIIALSGLFAYSYEYEMPSYNVDMTIGRNAVHQVKETLVFEYYTPHHGFFREIPVDYGSRSAHVLNVSCSDEFSKSSQGSYVEIKVGSADKYVSGSKTYTLGFDYDIGADENSGYDEFYYNIIGEGWQMPIGECTFTLRFPTEIDASKVWFTRGVWQSTDTSGISWTVNGSVITGRASNFFPGEALTVRVELPDGFYTGARERADVRSIFLVLNPVISLLLLALVILLWNFYGRDTVPIVMARFEPPRGMSPLLVGYIADSKVDTKDLTSMIFYWADKGYLSIREEKKDKYVFTKLKDMDDDSPQFEKDLFEGLFKNSKLGEIETEKLGDNGFYEAMMECHLKVLKYFKAKSRKLVDTKSDVLSGLSILLSFVPGILLAMATAGTEGMEVLVVGILGFNFVLNIICIFSFYLLFRTWYVRKISNFVAIVFCAIPPVILMAVFVFLSFNFVQGIVSALCAIGISFFAIIMTKRSKYGNQVLEEVLGYREFIDKVEMDKLKMMIDKDPELYYHVLGYAIVLGLEKKWANKFASLAVPQPTWYSGSNHFDFLYFTLLTSRMNNTINMNSLPKSTSPGKPGMRLGGSSFGSSGFSGGGFGGGGGGAW